MSKLYIKRNTGWLHNSSKIKVMVNGKKAFSLKDEEINHIDLEPGEYALSAKIWGYGGVERKIIVSDRENMNFNLKEGDGQWKYIVASLLILFIIYFALGSNHLIFIGLGLVGLSYLGFVMKRNKNKYLKLEEVII
ncbi:MAG: hypothetical protein ACPG6V_12455 [Flavobacteriales bacterium]